MSQENTAPAFGSLEWRNIGPHRGGRVVAVAGHPTKPMVFYFGATGGGVWKTTNGGVTWQNLSDGYFKTSSVGAIAIAESDPNVIVVGMGETSIRGNVTRGDGVYKSTDGGKTWAHLGLAATRHIGRVRIHPQNPDLIYVSALGHAFGSNPERGIYRTKDGGKTWDQILFRSEDAGAIDLSMDPTNPRILYAAFWESRRYPWALNSGGPGSSLYKSIDGGDTWVELTGNPGMPKGVLGKIGVAVAPSQSERVYAVIEAEEGGLFRSDDGGATWKKMNGDRNLLARAFYYMHIYADPQNAETVYVLNNFFWRSTDGGANWSSISTPHVDYHDLWIDPANTDRMISGNDGGGCVSFDAGLSWSSIYNQPTGEFYHVTTDSQFPYRVYGAQQDNTTLTVPSRSVNGGITERDWYNVGGAESGYIAVRQDDSNIVFAGSSGGGEGGRVSRYNHRTRQLREVSVWPEKTAGMAASEYKYRFQWTAPILLSPHDQNILYSCGNQVFRSFDEGENWECISPDLTRNDDAKQAASGGPITKDHTGVEVYCTVFAFAESPKQKGVLWAGSDDGLVHISRDNGQSWTNVTPPTLPEWTLISVVDPSPHDAAVAYVAATRYKLDDFRPFLYKTSDYGQTWTQITEGIPPEDFTRVIREDSVRRGLLFAGSESTVYVSFNDGAAWQPLQLNLPVVPIHDLVVKDSDLVVATHGRAFWILDDITPLRQLPDTDLNGPVALFPPRETYRFRGEPMVLFSPKLAVERHFTTIELPAGSSNYVKAKPEGGRAPEYLDAGQNPPGGVMCHFYLKEKPEGEVKLQILDGAGTVICTYSSKATDEYALKVGAGPNRLVWNMRYPKAETLPDPAYQAGYDAAPLACPGSYAVRLEVAGQTYEKPFQILIDPRAEGSLEDLRQQFDLGLQVREKVSEIHGAVKQLRTVREQVQGWVDRSEGTSLAEQGAQIVKRLSAIEDELIQTKWRSAQDTLNFPPKLNSKVNHLSRVVGNGDFRPTKAMITLFDELSKAVGRHLSELRIVLETDVESFTSAIRSSSVPLVTMESTTKK
jgi:photosystem II stability/assembly factor-like uncharacterized protein